MTNNWCVLFNNLTVVDSIFTDAYFFVQHKVSVFTSLSNETHLMRHVDTHTYHVVVDLPGL